MLLELDGGEWTLLYPGKREPDPLLKRLNGHKSCSEHGSKEEKKLNLLGIKAQTSNPNPQPITLLAELWLFKFKYLMNFCNKERN
jgi:hypothetical protein